MIDFTKNNGMCTIRDYEEIIETKEYHEIEQFSKSFMEQNADIFTDYGWNRNPVHAWSRRFEYTYVYKQILNHAKGKKLKIADLGCGLSFFPFFLKSKGYDIDLYDSDSSYYKLYHIVSKRMGLDVRFYPRSIDYIDVTDTYDILLCISVIEHIPCKMFSDIVDTIYKLLKPGGKFIFTLDVVLKNFSPRISVGNISEFTRLINNRFKSGLRQDIIVYDSKNHITPRYVNKRWGCSDTFRFSLKRTIMSIYRRKLYFKYPGININYGIVEKA